MTTVEPAILFWDIDGTLLTTRRAGIGAWHGALEEVTGATLDLDGVTTAGLTDGQIAKLLLEIAGGRTDDVTVDYTLRAYESRLPAALHSRAGEVLSGVREVLDDLSECDRAISLLLTGNTAAGAATKLAHYGLAAYFTRGGAFCESQGLREEIAKRGLCLIEGIVGRRPVSENVYVIGDTPHDIRCGQAIDARTIAVATGIHSLEELREASPWLAVDRIPEPSEFRSIVGIADSAA